MQTSLSATGSSRNPSSPSRSPRPLRDAWTSSCGQSSASTRSPSVSCTPRYAPCRRVRPCQTPRGWTRSGRRRKSACRRSTTSWARRWAFPRGRTPRSRTSTRARTARRMRGRGRRARSMRSLARRSSRPRRASRSSMTRATRMGRCTRSTGSGMCGAGGVSVMSTRRRSGWRRPWSRYVCFLLWLTTERLTATAHGRRSGRASRSSSGATSASFPARRWGSWTPSCSTTGGRCGSGLRRPRGSGCRRARAPWRTRWSSPRRTSVRMASPCDTRWRIRGGKRLATRAFSLWPIGGSTSE